MSAAPWSGLDPATVERITTRSQTPRGREAIAEWLDAYLAEVPTCLDALSRAAAESDPQALWRAAHQLNGSNATVGERGMVATGRQLEAMGKAGRYDGAAPLIQSLRDEFGRVHHALEQLRTSVGV